MTYIELGYISLVISAFVGVVLNIFLEDDIAEKTTYVDC